MVIAIGLNSLFNMPRGEDPSFKTPQFIVVAIYPGTSPTDMEELVVDPIEDKVNELENIKKIISNIDDGVAVLRVDFTYDSDPKTSTKNSCARSTTCGPPCPKASTTWRCSASPHRT
jgi:multidrug efflux pump subunit AcrB